MEDIGDDIEAVFRSGRISNFGPLVRAFERELSERLQVEHCLAVSNASIGLLLLLETLPRGSEVIVPSFTFLPTLQALLWNGLRPVFADIDPNTFTLCPGSVRSVMDEDVSAIVTVNVFGVPGDIEELTRIADHNGCQLYFDSAHGIGTRHDGQLIGGSGAAEVFSLSATKLLPCGEGGLVCTNLERIATQIVDRRNYGFRKGEANSGNLGVNARITEISAALGLWGLNNLDDYLKNVMR